MGVNVSKLAIPFIGNLRVKYKIFIGFFLILGLLSAGMLINYSSSQSLADVNDQVINKFVVINTKSYELSLEYEDQRGLYEGYANGAYQGAKDDFKLTEELLDENISELEILTANTDGYPIIESIKDKRLLFYNTIVNELMTLPTEVQLSDMELLGEKMLSTSLDMFTNMVEYKITGELSHKNSYDADKNEFSQLETNFNGVLGQIQGINSSIYNEFSVDYTALVGYYNTWVTNVMDPAEINGGNGTAWIESNTDSILPIENALDGIVQNVSIYRSQSEDSLANATGDLEPILEELKNLRDFSAGEIQQARIDSTNAVSLVTSTTFSMLLLGLIVSVIIGFAISNTIANPLSKLSNSSKTIASGDLTVNIDHQTNRDDEIGELADHFNQMVDYLKETVGEIAQIATTLSSAATEMASSSEEVNSSSEEISAIAQQMAKGSQEQTSQINESLKIALALRKDFEEKTMAINDTSNLIENIASQVNMLALNASIEAARAGEYGRGFAVVADNIRRLADSSKESVSKVQSIVETLKTGIAKSIDNLTNSIEKIASVAEETASGAEESSAATEEQAATMEEVTASAQELATVANNLENLVHKFKVI